MCAIKDLWSNRIIGYPIDSRMTVELAVAAVGSAVALQDVDEKILHSDRGPRTADRGLGPGNSLNYDGTKASSARWGGSGQAVTTPPTTTRQAHPDRIRGNRFTSRSRGLKTPNKTSQLNHQQTQGEFSTVLALYRGILPTVRLEHPARAAIT